MRRKYGVVDVTASTRAQCDCDSGSLRARRSRRIGFIGRAPGPAAAGQRDRILERRPPASVSHWHAVAEVSSHGACARPDRNGGTSRPSAPARGAKPQSRPRSASIGILPRPVRKRRSARASVLSGTGTFGSSPEMALPRMSALRPSLMSRPFLCPQLGWSFNAGPCNNRCADRCGENHQGDEP
jgi:hypothetical protein